jgi:hypothetical protein
VLRLRRGPGFDNQGSSPMFGVAVIVNDLVMPLFIIHHRHDANECPAAYAAWKGFDSPLRRQGAKSSCPWSGHDIWWDLDAVDADDALSYLPPYVGERSVAIRIGQVDIP